MRGTDIKKNYVLMVKGEWDLGEKVVDTPLQSKGQNDVDDKKNAFREALTYFSPVEYFSGLTLLNAEIKTGRTHQIRIHAAQMGFPVVGDTKHGDFAFNRTCKKNGLKRMFLHAAELSFRLNSMPKHLKITAPLANELKAFIQGLEPRKGDLPN